MPPPLYESLPEANGVRIRVNLRRTRIWKATGAAALVLLAVLGIALMGQTRYPSWSLVQQPKTEERVYLRLGAGVEGFGSALQHFKQSVVLSLALDATLILESNKQSTHGYSNSQIFNGRHNPPTAAARRGCRIEDYVPQPHRADLIHGWCAEDNATLEEIHSIKSAMANCRGILDTTEYESETTEDLNGCITPWIRDRLRPAMPPALPLPLTFPPQRPVTVGIHIRWGDTKIEGEVTDHFRGSMSIPNILRVLRDIRAEMGQHGVRLSVAMENANRDVLAQLQEADYTLFDSGDALADMNALSNSDFLLLGESSWGVMVHLVAPPGLSIVQHQGRGKYTNTTGFGRNLVFMEDYTPESLRVGWASPYMGTDKNL